MHAPGGLQNVQYRRYRRDTVELLHGGKGVGALNVKGIGEIPNVPTAAAIATWSRTRLGCASTRCPFPLKRSYGPSPHCSAATCQGPTVKRVSSPGRPWWAGSLAIPKTPRLS